MMKIMSFLSGFNWFLDIKGYARTEINGKSIALGKLLLNPPEGMYIDHINHM